MEMLHGDLRLIDNIRWRVVNIEYIRLMLHWVPRVALDRGLALTAEWLRGGGAGSLSSRS